MNTYLIPVSTTYGYTFKYFIPVFALTQEEAQEKASNLYEDRVIAYPPYEVYNFHLQIDQKLYKMSQKNDIINLALKI